MRTMKTRFLSNTPYAEIECMMQMVPGFRPQRSGMAVSRIFCSSCDCGKTNPDRSAFKESRAEAGSSPIRELLDVFATEVAEKAFVARVSRLSHCASLLFPDRRHRRRFEVYWKAQDRTVDEAAWCAAVYLLTADPFLWGKADAAIRPDGIHFPQIRIHGVDLDGYVLFHAAKDLYQGTKHISLGELTDPELVSDAAFRMVIGGFLIRRYGISAILKEGEGE
ncbi:hypothetical protein [Hungatella hathewayi]